MANLTKNAFSGGVVTETLVAAASGGDTIQNFTRNDFFVLRNAHATNPRTITIVNQETDSHGHDTDVAIVVAAVTTRIFDPAALPGGPNRFKDSNGHLQLTYSDSAADITIGVFTRS